MNAMSNLVVLEEGTHLQDLIAAQDSMDVFRCVAARGRDDVLTRLQNDAPDVFIARSGGGELDGISALELVKSLFPLIPVVISFEREDPRAIIDVLKRGATDYMVESDPESLLPALSRALDEGHNRRVQRLSVELLNHQQRALSLVASGMPVTDVLDLLLFILQKHLRNVGFIFHRVNAGTRKLDRLADASLSEGLRSRFSSLHLDTPVGCLAEAVHRERVCYSSEEEAHDWAGMPGGYPAPFPGVYSIPVISASENVIGLLTMLMPGSDEPDGTAMAIVDNLLQIASIALENEIREERLRDAIAEAERANREKSRFIVNLSHEIRTPMNGIIGMGDLLAQSKLDEDQGEILKVIRSSGDLLLNLIDDIIDLSRIETGRLQLDHEPFRLRESVLNIARLLNNRAAARGTEITQEFSAEIPEVVLGDELRLQQILTNLINNSIKFTEKGVIHTRVRVLKSADDDENTIRLGFSVSDTGSGIPGDKLKTIFAPFVQLEPRGDQRFRGAGLGLAISSSLVQLMGGRIQVESEVGKGSTFHFDLSLGLAEDHQLPVPLDEPSDKFEEADNYFPLSILVVEDDISNRLVIGRLLEKIGYQPEMANDGSEALARIAVRRFDIVLMDVQMPVMDGLETTRRIREEFPDRAWVIIALTANAMKEDMARCLEAGMADYLSKPVSLEQIRTMLLKWGRKLARG